MSRFVYETGGRIVRVQPARQIVVLRLYGKVLRQAGFPFSQAYMEDTLAFHSDIARRLIELFQIRHDPSRAVGRQVGRHQPGDVEHDHAVTGRATTLPDVVHVHPPSREGETRRRQGVPPCCSGRPHDRGLLCLRPMYWAWRW